MKIMTLLTDFNTRDGYVGAMKGVIWSILPEAQITDITHQIPPQDIRQGALALSRSVPYFPPGTVHVAVVDPGVGTARRPIAARARDFFLVGPDNGLFTLLFKQFPPAEVVHLDNRRFWLPELSSSFHGRDIFAPCGAHLAAGVPLRELGTPVNDPVLLDFPEPRKIEGGWRGEVIGVDAFGNLGTNLDARHIPSGQVVIRIAGSEIEGLSYTFGEKSPGELVALIDSDKQLAVGVVNGSAAARLGVGTGTQVEVLSVPSL